MPYKCPKAENYDTKRRYGITSRVRKAIIAGQQQRCSICGQHEDVVGFLHIDHDHDSGVVRGALCSGCNSTIAFARHDPKILRDSARYLEES